ncbi:MAG TPA: DUF2235 domain-containing protein [Dongiaceae bacterium]|nr:DUF2235 domain-containing protein [Dongiaceae bacterium]
MTNLIISCDGTWNTADQKDGGVPTPTNVARLHTCVADQTTKGVAQKKYYHPGVGTDPGLVNKVLGGGIGLGLDRNIQSAYGWLCRTYQPGDAIYLFGFSRGAYTVRSLGGLTTRCGLLDLSGIPDEEAWKRVETVFSSGYRQHKEKRDDWIKRGWRFHQSTPGSHDIGIHFIGVWDTVGALGIPDYLGLLNLLDDPDNYKFHDTTLSDLVAHARHAIALDEMRGAFQATLWTKVKPGHDVKQVWFPGVHSDVGGGYRETGLSDGALKWMIEEAAEQGLGVNEQLIKQIAPDCRGLLHNSLDGVFKHLPTQPRSAPLLHEASIRLHSSLVERRQSPPIAQAPYGDSRGLKAGESFACSVFAINPWNSTGLFLEAGAKYKFEAQGQWLDRTVSCGPGGTKDGNFQPGEVLHVLAGLAGEAESLFKGLSGNAATDFWATKRHEALNWFSLVASIANGASEDEEIGPDEVIAIGDGCEYKPKKSGYLYAYANDAWNFYSNNRGSVQLTVTRL